MTQEWTGLSGLSVTNTIVEVQMHSCLCADPVAAWLSCLSFISWQRADQNFLIVWLQQSLFFAYWAAE